ncbi:hypothetical protein AB4120_16945 [Cupriavidus sp. 2KB_3]|nr:hypothetical protein [Cupriavidus campinensis]
MLRPRPREQGHRRLARVVRGSGTMELTQQLVATGGGWQLM